MGELGDEPAWSVELSLSIGRLGTHTGSEFDHRSQLVELGLGLYSLITWVFRAVWPWVVVGYYAGDGLPLFMAAAWYSPLSEQL